MSDGNNWGVEYTPYNMSPWVDHVRAAAMMSPVAYIEQYMGNWANNNTEEEAHVPTDMQYTRHTMPAHTNQITTPSEYLTHEELIAATRPDPEPGTIADFDGDVVGINTGVNGYWNTNGATPWATDDQGVRLIDTTVDNYGTLTGLGDTYYNNETTTARYIHNPILDLSLLEHRDEVGLESSLGNLNEETLDRLARLSRRILNRRACGQAEEE